MKYELNIKEFKDLGHAEDMRNVPGIADLHDIARFKTVSVRHLLYYFEYFVLFN